MSGRNAADAESVAKATRGCGSWHIPGPISWLSVTDDLALALELADVADGISMERFRAHDLKIDAKPDLSPVTEADRAIETYARDRIGAAHPDHAIIGEEFGVVGDRGATWRWVIDPIDGTRSFVRGNETWATLIALQRDGESVVGVASAPAMRLRFHATLGGGSFLNGRRIHVSEDFGPVRSPDHAHRSPRVRDHQAGGEARRTRRSVLGRARLGQLDVAPRGGSGHC